MTSVVFERNHRETLIKNGPKRVGKSGFTLFEALIAFATATLIIGALIGMFSLASTHQNLRLKRLLLTEFASSVLEEYTNSFPMMPATGRLADGWSWTIQEETVVPDRVTALMNEITYVRLTARVWQQSDPTFIEEAITLSARRTSQ